MKRFHSSQTATWISLTDASLKEIKQTLVAFRTDLDKLWITLFYSSVLQIDLRHGLAYLFSREPQPYSYERNGRKPLDCALYAYLNLMVATLQSTNPVTLKVQIIIGCPKMARECCDCRQEISRGMKDILYHHPRLLCCVIRTN